ncbi:hypothetical protein HF086_005932 [Spodoptera exigua]|uniref:Uncharacterized protein n=1 Tax=Spodoptera exigua TaxID=7107 RepID=A0A922MTL8_SPOEX|nr:hypothetical protein HF086_005932 [Spodoptera exigua]
MYEDKVSGGRFQCGQHGPAGQAVGVAGARADRGDGAGAGAGQQRQEHAAGRAAPARPAPARAPRRAYCGARAGPLHQYVLLLAGAVAQANVYQCDYGQCDSVTA